MPAVIFDGAVVERTSHLRYLGIHFDRMLTYSKHVETTALKCKKGLSVLKAMAAKGRTHLFLQYQGVVLSVIDYGPGLTTTDKSAKAGQSAERGDVSHTRNHQGHPLRPRGSC